LMGQKGSMIRYNTSIVVGCIKLNIDILPNMLDYILDHYV